MEKRSLKARGTVSQRRGGFTMIELAVAIFIFCIGFAGSNKMHAMAIRGNAFNMQLMEATNVMKSRSEVLIGLPVESSSFGGSSAIENELSFLLPPVKPPSSYTEYTPSWTVNQVPGTALKKVIVTVRWTDLGLKHSVAVTFCR